jgi:hypothetical protein
MIIKFDIKLIAAIPFENLQINVTEKSATIQNMIILLE